MDLIFIQSLFYLSLFTDCLCVLLSFLTTTFDNNSVNKQDKCFLRHLNEFDEDYSLIFPHFTPKTTGISSITEEILRVVSLKFVQNL